MGVFVRTVHLRISRFMCSIQIVLIFWTLWPDNKHSNITDFSDKLFNDELHFDYILSYWEN